MTSIEEGLVAFLLADPTIIQLVEDRIEPFIAEQDDGTEEVRTDDHVVYKRIFQSPIRHLKGKSNLIRTRIAMVCYATTYAKMDAIGLRIMQLIEEPVPEQMGEFEICFSKVEDDSHEDDDKHGKYPGKEKPKFRRNIDITLWHRNRKVI